jgi:hypothetical protein
MIKIKNIGAMAMGLIIINTFPQEHLDVLLPHSVEDIKKIFTLNNQFNYVLESNLQNDKCLIEYYQYLHAWDQLKYFFKQPVCSYKK